MSEESEAPVECLAAHCPPSAYTDCEYPKCAPPVTAGTPSAAHCCEVCGDSDPRWSVERWGDAAISWGCDTHLAEVCNRLQRDNEITKLSVRNFRKAREWADIGRALDKIGREAS